MSGDKIGFKYSANKYEGVFVTDKIVRNFGVLLTTVLCTLGLPYKISREFQLGKYYQILSMKFFPHS